MSPLSHSGGEERLGLPLQVAIERVFATTKTRLLFCENKRKKIKSPCGVEVHLRAMLGPLMLNALNLIDRKVERGNESERDRENMISGSGGMESVRQAWRER